VQAAVSAATTVTMPVYHGSRRDPVDRAAPLRPRQLRPLGGVQRAGGVLGQPGAGDAFDVAAHWTRGQRQQGQPPQGDNENCTDVPAGPATAGRPCSPPHPGQGSRVGGLPWAGDVFTEDLDAADQVRLAFGLLDLLDDAPPRWR
jgi:hypothetical protein